MRILHVITSLRIGGAERLITHILPLFRKHGIKVELALFDATSTKFLSEIEAHGIKIYKLGNKFRDIYNPLQIIKLRKLLSANKYNLIHTHNTACQLFTAIAAKISKNPPILVTTEHNTSNRRRYWGWYKWIDKWMYMQYTSITCCSDAVRDRLVKSGAVTHPPNLITISNGVKLTSNTIKELKLKGRPIVMVAAFRPQKDHVTAIKAMTYLPSDIHLYFAGEGETMATVKDFVTKNNLDGRVHFLGNIYDIPSLYSSSRCAVLSTRHEGLPLSVIEAMASGTPVIATDVPGVTEIIGDAGLLVPESDPLALANAILKTIDDSPQRDALITAGLKRASMYDITTTANRYISLYNNLILKHI